MSAYEFLTIFVALIALVISAVSMIRARQVSAEQIELTTKQINQGKAIDELARLQIEQHNRDVATRDRPSFDVSLRSIGDECKFCVTNLGDGIAKDVEFEVIDYPDQSRFDTDLFPVDIKPQTTREVTVYLHQGMPHKYTVRLSWTERDGTKRTEDFKTMLS